MVRALVLATLFAVVPRPAALQTLSVLHIRILLADADGKATPVPRHALLISDNPSTVAPRLVTTALDGTVDVRLRPGNYTVESDQPVAFHGKAYEWRQTLDIAAGRDATLDLTAGNAEVETATTATPAITAPLEADPWSRLPQWQESVVALWTPTTHASGFLVDASGLIATSQRLVGSATSVEVQFSPALKVAGRVVAADAASDVAILRIDPTAAAAVRPVPLECTPPSPPVAAGQQIFAFSAPLRQEKGMITGTISRVESGAVVSDLTLSAGSAGGPVFSSAGAVVGITSVRDDNNGERVRGETPIVRAAALCELIASAQAKLKDAAPSGGLLPVESGQPVPIDALKEAAKRRVGSLNPYQVSSSEFDIAFITPVMIYGELYRSEINAGAHTTRATLPGAESAAARQLMDFGNWSEYVADVPPVLMVRATPKQVEGFWTKVARGAAQTQGVALPPMKRFKSGFSRLRAFCGENEVTPIHPFKLEHRVSENDTIDEGLYVFDPGALAPSCASVKLVLFSVKEPDKADTRVIEAAVIQRIWQDFESYRAGK